MRAVTYVNCAPQRMRDRSAPVKLLVMQGYVRLMERRTMIMAVSERVREIGLKKAVGAHTGDVLREYLMEAGLIGLIGGVIGYVLGFGLTELINASSGASPLFLITPKLTILVIGFAVVLASLAGVLPALRAARLDPVTALRTTN